MKQGIPRYLAAFLAMLLGSSLFVRAVFAADETKAPEPAKAEAPAARQRHLMLRQRSRRRSCRRISRRRVMIRRNRRLARSHRRCLRGLGDAGRRWQGRCS